MDVEQQDIGETAWRRTAAHLMAGGRRALDFLLPPLCLACTRPVTSHGALCASCWSGVHFIDRPYCDRLGLPLAIDLGPEGVSPRAFASPPVFGRARAALRFDGAGRHLIHRLKYGDRPDLAPALARWMARAGSDVLAEADVIVPVPLHWSRLLRRRFNQAAELGRALSHRTTIEIAPEALERIKATRPQVGLSATERGRNLNGAIRIREQDRHRIVGRRVVLVDDVLTTGATLNVAARVLFRAGAASVDAVVAAIVADVGQF